MMESKAMFNSAEEMPDWAQAGGAKVAGQETFSNRLENRAEQIAKTVDSIDGLIVDLRGRLGVVHSHPESVPNVKSPERVEPDGLLPRFDVYLNRLNKRVFDIERNLSELLGRI